VNKFKPKAQPNLDKTYKFYSIQQWTERKNGLGLLKSYFNAFTNKDDVLLVLKTYLTRVEVRGGQVEKLKEDIDNLKRALNFDRDYPPVYLIAEKLSTEQIIKMHEDCDCYTMLDRGEGFGLPYMEAAAAGNPIIATDYAGTREFLNKNNSYCVPWQPTYVCNMEWSTYYRGNDGGLWAEPNLVEASVLMREVYDNKVKTFELGQKARQDIKEYFNLDVITNRLLEALATVIQMARS
jgi:glycosyltransferase involved in cell wall biosynthesis